MPLNIAILVSGRGSNMEAILREIKAGKLDVRAKVVLSNKPEARALTIAEQYGVTTVTVPHKGLSREEHEKLLLEKLAEHEIDYVVLAGYMRVLSTHFLSRFRDQRGFFKVINIHPSLLPAFPGTDGYGEAFAYGVKVSGITVHLVDEKVDHGPILAQETFPRLPTDTLETFKARGLAVEHWLYPKVLQQIARNEIELCAREVPVA